MATAPEPEYSVPKEQSGALLQLALSIPLAKAIIGRAGRRGIRFALGRIAVESYTCFEEPILEPWNGPRLIFWRTAKSLKPSNAWYAWKGIVRIGNTYAVGRVHAEYRHDWKGNSRRAAEKHEQEGTEFRQVPLQEFAKAYHDSRHIDPMLRHGMIRVTKDHLKTHPEDVSILLAYTKEGQLGGGAIFVDYPDINLSHYVTSFLNPRGRARDFGYGYIDWWYQHLLAQKIVWADFGIMWQPGDPKAWQGSTAFKRRFRPAIYTAARYLRMTMK